MAGLSSEIKKATDAAKSGAESVKGLADAMKGLNATEGGKTRRASSSGGDIVTHMLTIRNQVKLYHWQTGSFARHKATDDLTASLDEKIDQFVEVYMGKYGRPKVSGTIKLHNFSDTAAKSFVAKETKYLTVELPKKVKSSDTDLLNIRDEILGDLNKVLYLFTLQ
jgi:DNA-binding ferritin-like protein